MKSLLLAALVLVSAHASAEGQIASLVNFESTAARPDSNGEDDNVTSIAYAAMEYTLPENISFYGGFSFVIGETFESGVTVGSRFYSATPAFQVFPGIPMWSFIGGGVSFWEDTVYYPEAGFRIATSDSSRLDVYVKILNSSNETYDKHIMIGAGLTF
ncbi:hypothetical protein [Marinomonas profundimaris]|uniref:Outer membrane protein beta-barrel domain-containing protein n=1 Tax=Marinomonas profundimaris TaxID=1208321 RepID=W1RVP0_9GAMM|nr:hypothetical protein [Marinomonas profundimaris]ETI61072.1 hypothetical protein D104_06280 [Marinomonas profundimaris]